MRLRFTPRAIQDLTEIADYIRLHDPAAAERVRSSILENLRTLTHFPYIGRRQKLEDVRKLVGRRYPYLIITPSMKSARKSG